jgi:hypothetical protein
VSGLRNDVTLAALSSINRSAPSRDRRDFAILAEASHCVGVFGADRQLFARAPETASRFRMRQASVLEQPNTSCDGFAESLRLGGRRVTRLVRVGPKRLDEGSDVGDLDRAGVK